MTPENGLREDYVEESLFTIHSEGKGCSSDRKVDIHTGQHCRFILTIAITKTFLMKVILLSRDMATLFIL